MCDQITYLAEQDNYRFVAICEHDTVHLTWDRFNIFLQPDELMSLDSSLDQAIAGLGEFVTSSSKPFSCNDNDTLFLLQIYELSIRLHPDDFYLMSDMINNAARQLNKDIFDEDIPRAANTDITVIELLHSAPLQHKLQFSLN